MSLDSFLIDKVAEPVAGQAMDRYGISHFRIAAELYALSMMALAALALHDFRDGIATGVTMTVMCALGAFFLYLVYYRDCVRMDESYDPDRRAMNATRISELVARYIWLGQGIFFLGLDVATLSFDMRRALFWLYLAPVICAHYFRACQGRPPRRRQRALSLATEGGAA